MLDLSFLIGTKFLGTEVSRNLIPSCISLFFQESMVIGDVSE